MSSLSSCLRLRYLERLLWWVLMWMGLTTLWMGVSMEDPRKAGLHSWLIAAVPTKIQTTQAITASFQQQQQHLQYLWTSNPVLPDWIKEYMDWHASIVSTLSVDNWQQHKYLILRCYRKDERCGGVSDRLKPVPLMVLAAQRSRRILLIDWDRPCPLSEFLVPPRGGFQWTPPSFLLPILQQEPNRLLTRAAHLVKKCEETRAPLLFTHIHDTHGGMNQYDEEFGPGSFQQIFHDLFRIFFSPSPGVQRLIDAHLVRRSVRTKEEKDTSDTLTTTTASAVANMDVNAFARGNAAVLPSNTSSVLLVEGEYNVAHYRAEYGREVQRHSLLTEPTFLRKVAINAIKCASELQSPSSATSSSHIGNVPIFFASDNPIALATARELATTLNYPIVTFDRSEQSPLKLDDYNSSSTRHNGTVMPSDYYSTFVDLYMAGSGKCVAFGRGGFGRFASLLSFNASCSFRHVQQFFPVDCIGRLPRS